MSELIESRYDYSGIPAEAADELESIVKDIEMTASVAAVKIGEMLHRAREIFRYVRNEGGFQGWVEKRVGYGRRTAYNLLDVYERFGGESVQYIAHISRTVLFALAAPSTPDEVIEQAQAKAESGEKVTLKDVEEWKAKALKAEEQNSILENRCEEWRQQFISERQKARAAEAAKPEIVEKIVEREVPVLPDDYEEAKAKYKELQADLARLREQHKQLKDEMRDEVDAGIQQGLNRKIDEISQRQKQLDSLERTIEMYKADAEQLRQSVGILAAHKRAAKEALDGIEAAAVALLGASDEGPIPEEARADWEKVARAMENGISVIRRMLSDSSIAIEGGK